MDIMKEIRVLNVSLPALFINAKNVSVDNKNYPVSNVINSDLNFNIGEYL